jgi:hypothetical protein
LLTNDVKNLSDNSDEYIEIYSSWEWEDIITNIIFLLDFGRILVQIRNEHFAFYLYYLGKCL